MGVKLGYLHTYRVGAFGETKVGGVFVYKVEGVAGLLKLLHEWKIYIFIVTPYTSQSHLIGTPTNAHT